MSEFEHSPEASEQTPAVAQAQEMKKAGESVSGALGLRPRSVFARLAESFVSDVIYTPIITFAMVGLAWKIAADHGARIPFLPMFLHSLLVCMIMGFALIFIFTSLYIKLVAPKR